jgi:hypothetical protein
MPAPCPAPALFSPTLRSGKLIRPSDSSWGPGLSAGAFGTAVELRHKAGSGGLQVRPFRDGQDKEGWRWSQASKMQVLPVHPKQQVPPPQVLSSVGLEVVVVYGASCGRRGRIVGVHAREKGFEVALVPGPSPAVSTAGSSHGSSSSSNSSSNSSSDMQAATAAFTLDQLHVIPGLSAAACSRVGQAGAPDSVPKPMFAKHEELVQQQDVAQWLEDFRLKSNIDLKLRRPCSSTLEAWLSGAPVSSAPGKQHALFVCRRSGSSKRTCCAGGEVGCREWCYRCFVSLLDL